MNGSEGNGVLILLRTCLRYLLVVLSWGGCGFSMEDKDLEMQLVAVVRLRMETSHVILAVVFSDVLAASCAVV